MFPQTIIICVNEWSIQRNVQTEICTDEQPLKNKYTVPNHI